MKAETRRRMNQTLAIFAVVMGFVLTSYWSLRDSLAVKDPTAEEIDGVPVRDAELASMRARIEDLEADLVAREQDCEELANTLNGAIADRNEAIAILRANGWVPEEGRAR